MNTHTDWAEDFHVMWGDLKELPFILEKVEKLITHTREEAFEEGKKAGIVQVNRGLFEELEKAGCGDVVQKVLAEIRAHKDSSNSPEV